MRPRSLAVVTAGIGQPSSSRLLADRLATATSEALAADGIEATVSVVEVRDHARDLVDHVLTGFPAPSLKAAIDTVLAADGLVVVSPIFNASYSGLFKTFFDVLERDSLDNMPVVLGATGGTARHSLALEHAVRPLFAYLGAATVPTAVFAAAEDWGRVEGPGDAALADRIDLAGRELARAIRVREPRRQEDPFADPVPFEDLLRAVGRDD